MTRVFEIESRVGKDGVLALNVPLSASDANTEVVITIRAKRHDRKEGEANWPPGYFESTYGSLADDPLDIPTDPPPSLD